MSHPATISELRLAELPFLSHWQMLQERHSGIIRWGTYVTCNPALPKQSNLAHIHGLTRLAEFYLRELASCAPEQKFDHELLMLAIAVHEDGEALLRRDILYHQKNDDHDFEEYAVYAASLGRISNAEIYLRAFLLQFVVKWNFQPFLNHARAAEILNWLGDNRSLEGKLFNALERVDYIHYAQMCWEKYGDPVILTHVLRLQTPALEKYATQIRGFANVIWTREQSQAAHAFMEEFRELPSQKEPGGIAAAYEWAYSNGHMEKPSLDRPDGYGGA